MQSMQRVIMYEGKARRIATSFVVLSSAATKMSFFDHGLQSTGRAGPLGLQAPDGGMQNRDASTVLLQVTHSNLASRFMEIRLDQHVRPQAPAALQIHCAAQE